ncbi:tail fiber domain-containing protein [Aureispira sp. CCB-E]|uniref:tail fiber domain-containing protein n=1 Tax=Aureispira sp. CCB-E TaxID=3051121 RepID=UPI0028685B9F|nr:tail fiber domain-containing protein [Aureispira sp. CCB-E]WMX12886.1 tail fiber domain-containing protein [Aureispira sp. CCB-E]
MKKLGWLIGLCCSVGLVNGQTNTSYGTGAGTGGTGSTFLGYYSGKSTTIGTNNVGVGFYSLYSNTSGYSNIGIGSLSLHDNTIGDENVGLGTFSLRSNTTGSRNTAIGNSALNKNTTGAYNTALGGSALEKNETGNYNTSTGYQAMYDNLNGAYNTSHGAFSLSSNTIGDKNTAMGNNAARANTTGKNLTAIGYDALRYNTTGTGNTAIGYKAGPTSAGSAYLYSSGLGAYAVPTASYQVRVGHFGITSIGGAQNWTNLSDGRFKEDVKENVVGLDFIKALRPVSYYVNNEAVNQFLGVELEEAAINNTKQYQTGFIAQEVEATAKELGFEYFGGVDAPKNENDHYGLRYAEFVVPLVKSVQELSAQNDELKALIQKQQAQIDALLKANTPVTLDSEMLSTVSKAKLYQNTPNPFSKATQIKVFLPKETEQALLQVGTIDGKQLLIKEIQDRGEATMTLDGSSLEAGIYLYTLIVDNKIVASKKMVLTK